MADPNIKTGYQCNLYYNTGTYASPTWALIADVENAKFSRTREQIRIKTRSRSGHLNGQSDHSVEFNILLDDDNTAQAALITAIVNGTAVELLSLRGDTSTDGSKGHRGSYNISQADENQPLDNGVSVDFQGVEALSENRVADYTHSV